MSTNCIIEDVVVEGVNVEDYFEDEISQRCMALNTLAKTASELKEGRNKKIVLRAMEALLCYIEPEDAEVVTLHVVKASEK